MEFEVGTEIRHPVAEKSRWFTYVMYDAQNPRIIQYVGSTADPQTRYAGHISEAKQKRNWIYECLIRGVFPVLHIEGVFGSRSDCVEREIELFDRYQHTISNVRRPSLQVKPHQLASYYV